MPTKSIAWNDGSGDYITLTYTGQGNGSVTISSPVNNGSARNKTITIETTQGGLVTKNVTISQAACIFPVGDIKNFSYTGSYQEVELPAGQYKLQCWGAQGGSNGTNSSYGITAKAGGKGGYSEGILTLSQKTTVRVYVGGQGTSSAGGFNGGGSTTGTSQYNASNEFGYSKMGGGGGATDIRLSDGSLYSRMIVAGGGSGGAMCYKAVTTQQVSYNTIYNGGNQAGGWFGPTTSTQVYRNILLSHKDGTTGVEASVGDTLRITATGSPSMYYQILSLDLNTLYKQEAISNGGEITLDSSYPASSYCHVYVSTYPVSSYSSNFSVKFEKKTSSSSTSTSTDSQVGYVGGGEVAGSYNTGWPGTQTSAGTGGSFGQGANQSTTNYRYCSAGGGGGWYGGGGGQKSDSSMTYCKYAGGGSGWVNIYANRGNRPSGYTGLQLDSGTTYGGNTSFPSTSGGAETGHSGNGYAKITRLA